MTFGSNTDRSECQSVRQRDGQIKEGENRYKRTKKDISVLSHSRSCGSSRESPLPLKAVKVIEPKLH